MRHFFPMGKADRQKGPFVSPNPIRDGFSTFADVGGVHLQRGLAGSWARGFALTIGQCFGSAQASLPDRANIDFREEYVSDVLLLKGPRRGDETVLPINTCVVLSVDPLIFTIAVNPTS